MALAPAYAEEDAIARRRKHYSGLFRVAVLQFWHITFIESPVLKSIVRRNVALAAWIIQSVMVVSGQTPGPAKPGSEFTETAGSTFRVAVQLLAPLSQRMAIYLYYDRINGGTEDSDDKFTCYGESSINAQNPLVDCAIPISAHGGEYQGSGTVVVRRLDTGKQREYHGIRLPIVTVLSNPLGADAFPDIVGTSLSLNDRQALMDGSRRSQDILNSLSQYVTSNTPNSKEVQAHLRSVADEERNVLNLTRLRYMSDPALKGAPNGGTVPIFFEDFDRRLRKVIRELGGTPLEPVARIETLRPHLLLAQLPHTSDSVTATDKSASVRGVVLELAEILLDATKGLFGMSDSGTTVFHWSAVTSPPGADIYYSRMGEPETKWVGQTDIKDATLEYAIWTFRFVWDGCSKREKPNPYLQHPIDMKLKKEGCQTK